MKFTFNTRRLMLALSAALIAALSTAPAAAQGAYPSKPITIVVAYPPGGDTDVLARVFSEKLSARVGQTVIVDNRTGAAGSIGAAYVAKAAPDGYTLLLAPNTLVITPHVMKSGKGAQYDPAADFTPIVNVGAVSLFMVTNATTGVTNVKELVAGIKAGKIQSYASPGVGTPMHILAELFDKAAGVKVAQVPYRGSAPAIADLVGGQVPLMYTTLGPALPHMTSGKLVALAVADAKRSPFMPGVPTLAELGYAGVEVGAWQGILGPKGMPADLVKTLNQHFNDILRMPDVIERMAKIAMVPAGGEAASFGQLVASEHLRYGKIVKEFGIQAE